MPVSVKGKPAYEGNVRSRLLRPRYRLDKRFWQARHDRHGLGHEWYEYAGIVVSDAVHISVDDVTLPLIVLVETGVRGG